MGGRLNKLHVVSLMKANADVIELIHIFELFSANVTNEKSKNVHEGTSL